MTNKTETRYLVFLSALYSQAMIGKPISSKLFASEHRVSRALFRTLIDMGIIERAERGKYSWTGAVPTLTMARELLQTNNARTKQLTEQAAEQRQAPQQNALAIEPDQPEAASEALQQRVAALEVALFELNSALQAQRTLIAATMKAAGCELRFRETEGGVQAELH